MSNLGFFKSIVYHGEVCLGEVEVSPTVKNQDFQFPNNEIRINYISQQSERCLPLSILQTLSPFTVRCKLRANFTTEQSLLYRLYIACLYELKTAVVLLGNEELHLVALPSRQEKFPCFWCCSVPIGLYGSCSVLLNRRCLAIVFDLDETLIVANTMKSFEDRIEALQKRISIESDPGRKSGMTAERSRYLEDQSLLKHYAETDSVLDNGQLLKVHSEEVPSLSGDHERMFRPIIRLKDKNIVLTRINPEVRDTSVLVRLRPAWEDLRSYLTAKGRKRFEVYVSTMAERDYALEIWRLLDPELHLISSNQLLGRVVCVNSGSRKSLLSVFHDRMCHPKMALVIDDRLKVWEDMDQPRVHVVPPFTPYYAPLADTANAVPVLCVARNVACNVRAGFFKEFDENMLRRISEICYEDEIANLPYAPDVSDYMMSEDPSFVPNGNREIPFPEGMNGTEVERRLNRSDDRNMVDLPNPDMRPETPHPPITVLPTLVPGTARASLPVQKAGLPEASRGMEVHSSETNPDTCRRLGEQSSVGSPLLPKPPSQLPASSSLQGRGGWLVEDNSNTKQLNNGDVGLSRESSAAQDKIEVQQNLPDRLESSILSVMLRASETKNEEARLGQERKKHNHLDSSLPLTSGNATGHQASASSKVLPTEAGKSSLVPPFISIGVLQEIGRRCGSKIEFRSVVSTSKDLQFSVEVLFTGQKIAAGMGKTKKDAQQQAAQNALRCLADEYVSYITPRSGLVDRDLNKLPSANENGFLWDDVDPGTEELPLKEALPEASISEAAEETTGGSGSFGTRQRQKRPNSPRLLQSDPTKRFKVELPGSQVSSSQYQKTGDPVS